MKVKKILLALLLGIVVVGCSDDSEASSENATYIESSDEYNSFYVYKLVDKESGCKYMITKNQSNGQMTSVQMEDADGMPMCK